MKNTRFWNLQGYKKAAALAAIAVLASLFLIFKLREGGNGGSETITVKLGRITQEVSVVGSTKPVDTVNLAFETGGKISELTVDVGSKVFSGEILARISNPELSAQLRQAEATILGQKAKLDELKRGARAEDIEVKKAELEKAKRDLENDYAEIYDSVNDAYAKAEDAVRKQTDPLFGDDEGLIPRLSFRTSNSQLQTDLESKRADMTIQLNSWKNDLAGYDSSVSSAEKILSTEKGRLRTVRLFLEKAMAILTTGNDLSASLADSYKANIGTARANINTALDNLTGKEQAISSGKLVVKRIENELALKLAGTSPEEIRSQEASIEEAAARADSYRAQIAKTILRSPIGGVVTKKSASIGEITSPNIPILSVITDSKLEIEANVPEIDIGKISRNNDVKIVFDAFPGEIFEGRVFYIDPAETIVAGVSNFKIKIVLSDYDPRMKSGLTANLSVITNRKDNALIVPAYAVQKTGGGYFVTKKSGEKIENAPVTLGIKSQDGNVEITSGVAEGDVILVPKN